MKEPPCQQGGSYALSLTATTALNDVPGEQRNRK